MPHKISSGKWKWGNIIRDSKNDLRKTVWGIWKKSGKPGKFSDFWETGKTTAKLSLHECFLSIKDNIIVESRIDFAQKELNKHIWDKDDSGNYILNKYLKSKIFTIKKIFEKNSKFTIDGIRIIGSNTSTQYDENTDIDVHLTIFSNKKSDILEARALSIKLFRNKYKFKTHAIEVYVQDNIFQDLSSIGCYDVINDEWIVGPELIKTSFNPYKQYKNIFNIVEKICRECDIVLGELNRHLNDYTYLEETLSNAEDKQKTDIEKLLDKKLKDINKCLKSLFNIKTEIRNERHKLSMPKNEKDALKYRKSKKWQKTDAIFKFVAKYGYLKIISNIEDLTNKQNIEHKDVKKLSEIV